jgi:hypothetical protein
MMNKKLDRNAETPLYYKKPSTKLTIKKRTTNSILRRRKMSMQNRNVQNTAAPFRGNAIMQNQTMWRETYTYDLNGNRATKTTLWGTIRYEYDAFGQVYDG